MRRRSTGEAKISSKSGVTPALLRSVVEGLESLGASAQGERTDLRPPLALLAGRNLELDEDELHGARRRALLLLAAGGDPERGLVLDGRAVVALADELMTSGRLAALTRGLESLR